MLPLILALTSRPASADCHIFGTRPTVTLPTTSSGQVFSFLASDDCETLRLSIQGTGLSWRPKGPSGSGPSTYRVVLTDDEWDQVSALVGPTLTWVVTGRSGSGAVTRVETTNDVRGGATRGVATADAILLGGHAQGGVGRAIAPAGDVDGDGWPDVLLGAPSAGPGTAYMIGGPVTGTIELSETGTQFLGVQKGETAGTSVAGAGDVDGDGYDDVLISAPLHTGLGRDFSGATYLVLGPVSGSFDLSLADAIFMGAKQFDRAGNSVSSAGDVDGDGLPDVLVGAQNNWVDGDHEFTGAAYVMSGTRRGRQGFRNADASMHGATTRDFLGNSVDGLGDVNGDGLDDILIAAALADGNGSDSGAAYVVFGPVDGEYLPSEADATLVGEAGGDYAGSSTAPAGDVDGDGLQDILIGAMYHDETTIRCGAAYLVQGGVTGTLWLGDADARLYGENVLDVAGTDVAGVGDVNGDGHDDLVVGARQNEEGGPDAGAAYLVRGPVTGSIDLWRADLKLIGHTREQLGYGVAGAGDLDADGLADVLVGAPDNDRNGRAAGAAYVLYGSGL